MERVPRDGETPLCLNEIGEIQAAALVVNAFGSVMATWGDPDYRAITDTVQVAATLEGVAQAFIRTDARASDTGAGDGEICHYVGGGAGLVIEAAIEEFRRNPESFLAHLSRDQLDEAQMQFPPVATPE